MCKRPTYGSQAQDTTVAMMRTGGCTHQRVLHNMLLAVFLSHEAVCTLLLHPFD